MRLAQSTALCVIVHLYKRARWLCRIFLWKHFESLSTSLFTNYWASVSNFIWIAIQSLKIFCEIGEANVLRTKHQKKRRKGSTHTFAIDYHLRRMCEYKQWVVGSGWSELSWWWHFSYLGHRHWHILENQCLCIGGAIHTHTPTLISLTGVKMVRRIRWENGRDIAPQQVNQGRFASSFLFHFFDNFREKDEEKRGEEIKKWGKNDETRNDDPYLFSFAIMSSQTSIKTGIVFKWDNLRKTKRK